MIKNENSDREAKVLAQHMNMSVKIAIPQYLVLRTRYWGIAIFKNSYTYKSIIHL
uniref:Truncated ribosomal protein L22 n=1 Tax=Crepidium acuminatum TaxID=421261 RepID=A0A8K1PIQ2_9ASPA|nr:truncated ribosomal protein L22 [Crepidium acuminatum]